MTLKELHQQLLAAAATIRSFAKKIHDENRGFTGEETANWDKMNADYDRLAEQIRVQKIVEERQRDADALFEKEKPPVRQLPIHDADGESDTCPPERERRMAMEAWGRGGGKWGEVSDQSMAAAKRCGVNAARSRLQFNRNTDYEEVRSAWRNHRRGIEYRAQATTSAAAGGALVPQDFMRDLEFALLYFGPMRSVSRIVRTTNGAALPWPKYNDTGQVGAILAENTIVTAQDITFATQTFLAYKYQSKAILVSQELLEDSAFNVNSEVSRALGERLGRIQNTHFTTGTGSGQPQGVVTALDVAATRVTAANAASIVWTDLIRLMHSVDVAYRSPGECFFMMNDQVASAIRQIFDTTGRPLWEPSHQVGDPSSILGFPVVINNDMSASIATTLVTVVFGNFQKYIIREVADMRFYRLDERYRDLDQVGFVAYSRHDGQVLNAGTNPLKCLKQA